MGRVVRDIERKAQSKDAQLAELFKQAHRLLAQQKKDKNKLYSIHEPQVRCIAKGKVHKPYEFGNKASFVTTSKHNWLVSAQSLRGNPFDGHTLRGALTHVEHITQRQPSHVYVDGGYRGHGIKGNIKVRIVGQIPKRASRSARRWMKRRAAIEPTIGHLKSEHRLSRNYLKGEQGDHANVVLAAAGYNLAKLLTWLYCVWVLCAK